MPWVAARGEKEVALQFLMPWLHLHLGVGSGCLAEHRQQRPGEGALLLCGRGSERGGELSSPIYAVIDRSLLGVGREARGGASLANDVC